MAYIHNFSKALPCTCRPESNMRHIQEATKLGGARWGQSRIAVTIAAKGVKPELFYSMDESFVWFVPLGGAHARMGSVVPRR
eukprot:349946-Chlamydomonas_euryale.AAC.3